MAGAQNVKVSDMTINIDLVVCPSRNVQHMTES